MKIFRFYTVMISVVISSLIYVHQQVEIIKLNYILKNNEIKVTQLLDHNGVLMYNIEKLENPHILEERLHSTKEVFTMPESWRVVKSEKIKENIEVANSVAATTESRKSIFDFLVPKALAQAKPTRE